MFGDTGALSFQLDMYRWEDHLRRMQNIRESRIDQETADVVLARYNQLVQRYNSLAEAAVQAGRTADFLQDQVRSQSQKMSDLQRQLAAVEAENIRIREVWARSAGQDASELRNAEEELRKLRSQQE